MKRGENTPASRDERLAVAARLAQVSSRRRALRVFGDEAQRRLDADGFAILERDRRGSGWRLLARAGRAGGVGDACLFTDAASRDPKHAVRRLARPLRPWGRLAGGAIVYRHAPVFSWNEARRLGRLSRVVSADLERRDREARAASLARLYRKLAGGVRPIDALYHALDDAARLCASDHTVTLLATSAGMLRTPTTVPATARGSALDSARWTVVAEKVCRPGHRSPRIGREVSGEDAGPVIVGLPAASRALRMDCAAGSRGALRLVTRRCGGDDYDDADREVLEALAPMLTLAFARLRPPRTAG